MAGKHSFLHVCHRLASPSSGLWMAVAASCSFPERLSPWGLLSGPLLLLQERNLASACPVAFSGSGRLPHPSLPSFSSANLERDEIMIAGHSWPRGRGDKSRGAVAASRGDPDGGGVRESVGLVAALLAVKEQQQHNLGVALQAATVANKTLLRAFPPPHWEDRARRRRRRRHLPFSSPWQRKFPRNGPHLFLPSPWQSMRSGHLCTRKDQLAGAHAHAVRTHFPVWALCAKRFCHH